MHNSYLEVTYRHGKPLAAYIYLPRRPGDSSARTEKRPKGIIIDYAADGRPIGIELTSPSSVDLATVNEVISRVDEPANAADLRPLMDVA